MAFTFTAGRVQHIFCLVDSRRLVHAHTLLISAFAVIVWSRKKCSPIGLRTRTREIDLKLSTTYPIIALLVLLCFALLGCRALFRQAVPLLVYRLLACFVYMHSFALLAALCLGRFALCLGYICSPAPGRGWMRTATMYSPHPPRQKRKTQGGTPGTGGRFLLSH